MIIRLFIISSIIFTRLFVFGQFVIKPEKDTTKRYFPNSINSQWTYEIYDEIKKTSDTVIVSIVGDTTIYEKPYMIWVYKYSTKREKLYYSKSKDSIEVINAWDYNYNFMYDIVQLYLIPFEFQQKWDIPSKYQYQKDNWNSVIDINETVMVGASVFRNTVLIKHRGSGFNQYLTERIWFKPYIGIIKKEYNPTGWSFANETWKLIDWKIE
jgi:hypothetical protein